MDARFCQNWPNKLKKHIWCQQNDFLNDKSIYTKSPAKEICKK